MKLGLSLAAMVLNEAELMFFTSSHSCCDHSWDSRSEIKEWGIEKVVAEPALPQP